KVLRDGWLYTGDLAVIDDAGYHRIVGRKKEMIVVSGFKVFPDEVDRMLMSHPAVLESATIGVPDAKRGERVKAFVVLKPGHQASPRGAGVRAGPAPAPASQTGAAAATTAHGGAHVAHRRRRLGGCDRRQVAQQDRDRCPGRRRSAVPRLLAALHGSVGARRH